MSYPPDGGEWQGDEYARPVRGEPRPRAGGPMPDWRDSTDPRGQRATRSPRGRGGGGLPPRIPTIPTVLTALVAVVLAFVIGRASGGGGGDAEVSATPSSVSTTSTTLKIGTHTVAKGESLSSIAASYGLTTDELASFNGITNINEVFVGQKLSIPTTGQPTVSTTSTTKAKSKESK